MRLRHRLRRLAGEFAGEAMSGAEALASTRAMAEVIKRHVTDREMLQAMAAELRHLAAGRGANQR